mmetsp:Transcript_53024/g.93135  ORF Transcript_53024/g.93135 Transcript_53024/m.93135 type:complete len:254 (-) Transcript_53024:229-990(-)
MLLRGKHPEWDFPTLFSQNIDTRVQLINQSSVMCPNHNRFFGLHGLIRHLHNHFVCRILCKIADELNLGFRTAMVIRLVGEKLRPNRTTKGLTLDFVEGGTVEHYSGTPAVQEAKEMQYSIQRTSTKACRHRLIRPIHHNDPLPSTLFITKRLLADWLGRGDGASETRAFVQSGAVAFFADRQLQPFRTRGCSATALCPDAGEVAAPLLRWCWRGCIRPESWQVSGALLRWCWQSSGFFLVLRNIICLRLGSL